MSVCVCVSVCVSVFCRLPVILMVYYGCPMQAVGTGHGLDEREAGVLKTLNKMDARFPSTEITFSL